jgi:hypothetical protein
LIPSPLYQGEGRTPDVPVDSMRAAECRTSGPYLRNPRATPPYPFTPSPTFALMRMNIWIILAALLALLAITRYAQEGRNTQRICADDPTASVCHR